MSGDDAADSLTSSAASRSDPSGPSGSIWPGQRPDQRRLFDRRAGGRTPRDRLRPARRAAAQRTGRLDVGQRVGARARRRLLVIKPALSYDDLTPESMVVCDLDGNAVSDGYSPSSDTATHAYIYRHMPEVGGVVHTHSTYATAWAALGEPIPCVITAMADEFGGEIPVGPFAHRRRRDRPRRGSHADRPSLPAVLMRSHGSHDRPDRPRCRPGRVMCEDVARTVHAARLLGQPGRWRRTRSTR